MALQLQVLAAASRVVDLRIRAGGFADPIGDVFDLPPAVAEEAEEPEPAENADAPAADAADSADELPDEADARSADAAAAEAAEADRTRERAHARIRELQALLKQQTADVDAAAEAEDYERAGAAFLRPGYGVPTLDSMVVLISPARSLQG